MGQPKMDVLFYSWKKCIVMKNLHQNNSLHLGIIIKQNQHAATK